MLEVQLWDEQVRAYDCDEVTAAWFSNAIGVPCRLARFHPDVVRTTGTKWTGGIAAPTLFSDGYPLLVASVASLDDVNEKLHAAGRAPLPMNRFRPNLVLDGIGAFEEDYADALQFGATTLKPVKPCPRCPIPSVDQATGVPGPDPLDVMRGYRAKPELDGAICFGMNAIVIQRRRRTHRGGPGSRFRAGVLSVVAAQKGLRCHMSQPISPVSGRRAAMPGARPQLSPAWKRKTRPCARTWRI